jgi:membrane protein insertase Oxa1/YidC/SpoIIIJ
MANNSADFDDKESAITWWKTFTENEAKVNAGTATEDETTAYNTSKAYYDANKDTLFQTATEDASKAAVDYWNANKGPSSWLWVQNIWVADSTAKPFPLYSTLQSNAKSTGYSEYVDAINEDSYNRIATIIIENSPRANNGYYILAVLAGVITFAAQYITELHTKLKNKKANALAKAAGNETASSMKMLKIIMPIIMVVFVLTTSASFGLYILSSNVSSILLGELTTLAVDKLTKNKRIEVEASLEKEANKLIKKGRL